MPYYSMAEAKKSDFIVAPRAYKSLSADLLESKKKELEGKDSSDPVKSD